MNLQKFLEIKTYKELYEYVKAFKKRQMGLMIIVSRAGLGKTFITEEVLDVENPLVLNSHITPLKLFESLLIKNQEETDFLAIIDEAEMMFMNSKIKSMLKVLCDTKLDKTIKYLSSTPAMKDLDSEFITQSKVLVLINTLEPKDEHIKAIMSRGHLLYFKPSDIEIFNYMKTWATDKEILKFIENFAPFTRSLDLRTYIKAVESKKSGLDWQKEVVSEISLDRKFLEIKKLLERKDLTDKQRLKLWSSSRATFYRFKRLYLSKQI